MTKHKWPHEETGPTPDTGHAKKKAKVAELEAREAAKTPPSCICICKKKLCLVAIGQNAEV